MRIPKWGQIIDIEGVKQIAQVCLLCPLLAQRKIAFFSSFSAAAAYRTNKQLKQSIIFRCLWDRYLMYFCIIKVILKTDLFNFCGAKLFLFQNSPAGSQHFNVSTIRQGQGKLTYTFSAERHRLSALRPSPRLLVPRERNIGTESGSGKSLRKGGKRVRWFTRAQSDSYAFICLPLDHPSAICFQHCHPSAINMLLVNVIFVALINSTREY